MSTKPRGKRIIVKCATCKDPFLAREADIKRGWGRFCSKSCKASKQHKQKPWIYFNYLEST